MACHWTSRKIRSTQHKQLQRFRYYFPHNLLSYLSNDVHALSNVSENDVLSVEPGGLGRAEEELRAVGVGASISHGQDA